MAQSSTVLLGPWGGEDGNPWSHTLIGEISNIFITHGNDGVNSVRFVSRDAISGTLCNTVVFGVANGTEYEIKIDSPVEKLISIEGSVGVYNSVEQVTSLGFTTSKTKHSPVGAGRKDTEFSCLLNNDPIVGFHGRSGTVLNSIGVSIVIKTRELVGPWPSTAGGGPWVYTSEARGPWGYTSKAPISFISVTYDDDIVRSVHFGSHGVDGNLLKSSVIGSENGGKTSENKIDTKVEKLIGITGTYGSYARTSFLESVTFITDNFKSFGPFGARKASDTSFSYTVKDNEVITGFHGQVGSLIDSIGIYIQPSKSSAKVGPFNNGAGGGTPWSYEPKGLISRIFISHGGVFNSIQFESIDESGNKETSKVFGTGVTTSKYTIEIEKDDKLSNISGTTFSANNQYLSRLFFSTEKKRVYGPFGSDGKGVKFSYPVTGGYISGFHGQSSGPLHAIGIYVKPN